MIFEGLTLREIEDRADARIVEIAKKHHLSAPNLKCIFRNVGMNNTEISEKCGLNRNTVNKYVRILARMDQDDVMTLMFMVAVIEHSQVIQLMGIFIKDKELHPDKK